MATLKESKSGVGRFYGDVTFTGSVVIDLPVPHRVLFAEASLASALAADAGAAVQFSWERNSAVPGQFTLYAWKENAGTDRIAATASITASVIAFAD